MTGNRPVTRVPKLLNTKGPCSRSVEDELGQDAGRRARIAKAEREERRQELAVALVDLKPDHALLDDLADAALDVDAGQLLRLLIEGRQLFRAQQADAEIRERDHVHEMRLRRAGTWRTQDNAGHWRSAPRVISKGRPDLQTRSALRAGLRALGVTDRALRERCVRLALAPGVYSPAGVVVTWWTEGGDLALLVEPFAK